MKLDRTMLLIVGGILLLGGVAASGATLPPQPPRKKPDDDKDGADLVRRANLPAASAWRADFAAHGLSDSLAAALARWAGIESSGNPIATSRLGERGLLQCSKNTALMAGGPYTQVEWDSLVDKTTPRTTHARLAIQLYEWLAARAAKYVPDMPGDDADRVFYAKLYHQWPADFHGKAAVGLHGPALDMAHDLAVKWSVGSPHSLHRLRAASVVAWNAPAPWSANA
jgi:hypothetical protein